MTIKSHNCKKSSGKWEHETWQLLLSQFFDFNWPVDMKTMQKLPKKMQIMLSKTNEKLCATGNWYGVQYWQLKNDKFFKLGNIRKNKTK